MHAEASHPYVLVVDTLDSVSCRRGDYGSASRVRDDETRRRSRAVHVQVRDVETHIEVLGHVPLGARANPPASPVVVAARLRKGESAISGARAFQRAEHIIGLRVVPYARPATIQ